jgi:hypothetical protein
MDVITKFKTDVEKSERGRIMEIAAKSGVSLRTLRNLYYGYTSVMSYHHMQLLERFYKGKRARG